MQSKFYQPDEHRAEKVHELFAKISRRYDLLNDIMSAGMHRCWKHRLVGAVLKDNPAMIVRVLDMCCGTGDLAIRFLTYRERNVRVVGVDFTAEMLQVAERRASRAQVMASWCQADALRLPFPDNSFDAVSVGYGLRNLADLEAGLREILRVLRPGGKLLSLDFGKPENRMLRTIYFGYLHTVLPVLGRLYCGDPDTHGYILVSLQNYGAQQGVKELMEWCGYRDCGIEEFVGGTMAINFGRKPN